MDLYIGCASSKDKYIEILEAAAHPGINLTSIQPVCGGTLAAIRLATAARTYCTMVSPRRWTMR